MYKLEASNKRLVIEHVKKLDVEDTKSGFIIPEKMRKTSVGNEIYRVLDCARDCSISISIGALVMIEGNMVEETKVGEQTFLTVKENFVIGILREV
jgi:co-chaperonin GroES (HSP10)